MLIADKISENHSKTEEWKQWVCVWTCISHRMCSSVTVKALQSGWDVFSQMAGFFSAAIDVCPVIGEELMCRALAMAESRVSSLESGPTPAEGQRKRSKVRHQFWSVQVLGGDLLCSPLGRSMDRRTSSAMSNDRSPFNRLSQNSCRKSWQTIERQMEHSSCQPRPVFCSDSCLLQSLNANQTLLVTNNNKKVWILLKKKEYKVLEWT